MKPVLLASDPPSTLRVDPRTVLLVEVALLALAGVGIPIVLLLSKTLRREPRMAVSAACVAVLMVHAFVSGEPVRRESKVLLPPLPPHWPSFSASWLCSP